MADEFAERLRNEVDLGPSTPSSWRRRLTRSDPAARASGAREELIVRGSPRASAG